VTTELPTLSMFLIGLFGSVHCIGMCGGITGALTMGLPSSSRHPQLSKVPYLAGYNLGRITSYILAGLLVGFIGSQAELVIDRHNLLLGGRILAAVFMILLGLYLASWWTLLTQLERLGSIVWTRIEPLGRRLLPVRNPLHALGLGLVWGWLPCGMVYSVLGMALVSGSTIKGGLLMASFGIGTLPMLLAMGATAISLRKLVSRSLLRQLAGSVIILFGLWSLFSPSAQSGYEQHQGVIGPDSSAIKQT